MQEAPLLAKPYLRIADLRSDSRKAPVSCAAAK
jgi:hypothetical protein